MSIQNELTELLENKIISEDTAKGIRNYYKGKAGKSENKLFIIFGILGALLTGLGIILIVAHNWDEFSLTVKTTFAFIPLITGQLICGFVLFKKIDSSVWRESSTVFLFFAVGTCISLISQIYHIEGELSSFILTWMALCIPLVYIMRSSATSLLYIIGITFYAVDTGYSGSNDMMSFIYWIMLMLIIPYYIMLIRRSENSNFLYIHNVFIPLSLIITLGTISEDNSQIMYLAYMYLFTIFIIISNTNFSSDRVKSSGALSFFGISGILFILFVLSFNSFWEDLSSASFSFNGIRSYTEIFASVILGITAFALLILRNRNRMSDLKFSTDIFEITFIIFTTIFIIGIYSDIAVVLINLLLFIIGIMTILKGIKLDHLGILNIGLLIISGIVICRFFDTDLSFIIRGILFVIVGLCFFGANLYLIKKRKTNEAK